ncbi:APC family permease [Nonomuraea sp. NPDC050310]|uniref:APC family permease n=1 Tax=Nonomuraea sp. NPDC050310 TaxID=3154935 RepID=UPI00340FC7E3
MISRSPQYLPQADRIGQALARNRLGVGSVVFFVLSAAAPLTVVAGVLPTGYAATGITGLPIAFLAVGTVLALFAVGYVEMARRVANAGAFYTYITHGLGRPSGVAAAWVSLLTYNTLQVALYGGIGAAAAPLLADWLGWDLPWWLLALAMWLLVGSLGLARVDINGKILALLLSGEVAVIVLFGLTNLAHPTFAAGGVDMALSALSPASLFSPGIGALLAIAVLGFVGFEAAVVYSEESREPGRTVPTATYISIATIALLYGLFAWTMQIPLGSDAIVEASQKHGAETIFVMAGEHLHPTVITVARILFVTSVFAAALAVHNTTGRYVFALGREGVLPSIFGRTSPRSGAPIAGSLTQSAIALAVIVTFAVFGADPVPTLFFAGGALGGLGILLLASATAIAIVVYFARRPRGLGLVRRRWAPTAAAVLLLAMLTLVLFNFHLILGVPEGDSLAWVLPSMFVFATMLGLAWAALMRATRPDQYQQVGLGADADLASTRTV